MDTSKIKKYAHDFWEDVRSGKKIIDNRTPKNVAEELAVYIAKEEHDKVVAKINHAITKHNHKDAPLYGKDSPVSYIAEWEPNRENMNKRRRKKFLKKLVAPFANAMSELTDRCKPLTDALRKLHNPN